MALLRFVRRRLAGLGDEAAGGSILLNSGAKPALAPRQREAEA